MNKWIGIGRLVANPEVRQAQGADGSCVARYRLAVNRRYKKEGQQDADFISCVAFGKNGEFAEKYLKKGMKIAVSGRIQTGSYTNKDGVKVYTTDIVVEEHDFCESKGGSGTPQEAGAQWQQDGGYSDGFMNIPDGLEEELPFD